MLSITHKMIAKKVYEAITSEYGFNIDILSLNKGSIAPDILPSMMFTPHTLDGSLDKVEEAIRNLCLAQPPVKSPDIERFSFKLGIVMHFISDYFCLAHNEKRYDNIFRHYIYERKLRKLFEKKLNKMDQPVGSNSNLFQAKGSISDHIRNMHKEYIKVKKSMANDFLYSITVSRDIARRIVSCIIENSNAVRMKETA